MASLAQAFSTDQITRLLYNYELVTYTYGPATLPTGLTKIYDLQGWNANPQVPVFEATLLAINTALHSGVQFQWTYDTRQSDPQQGWANSFPENTWYPIEAPAVNNASLYVNNTSGAAIANFQFLYTVGVKRLTTAERLLRAYDPVAEPSKRFDSFIPTTDDERFDRLLGPGSGLAALKDAIDRGTQPIDFTRTWDALFANRIIGQPTDGIPLKLTIASGGVTQQVTNRATPGTALILTGLWANQPASAGAIDLIFNRDNQTVVDSGYVDINTAALSTIPTPIVPLPYLVPAVSFAQFQVRASSAVGANSDYFFTPYLKALRVSSLLALRLGITQEPAESYAKVRMGWQ